MIRRVRSDRPLRVHTPAWFLVRQFLRDEGRGYVRVASANPDDYDLRILGARALRERAERLNGHAILHVERVVPGQVPFFAVVAPDPPRDAPP